MIRLEQHTAATVDIESLLGRRYRLSDDYEVGREKIREFARAVQHGHRAHHDEQAARVLGHDNLIAPMTFTAIFAGVAQRCVFRQFLPDYDLSRILHTEQRIEQHRPVRVGDVLGCRIGLEAFQRRHGQDSFVLKTEITDKTEAVVQTGWTTIVAFAGGGRVDENITRVVDGLVMRAALRSEDGVLRLNPDDAARLGIAACPSPPPSTRRPFHEVFAGIELPARTVRVARGDLVNYAGVAGDPNPIHWSERVAALVGLDNVVAHGMLTMALGAGYVSDWVGDPAALLGCSVRFIRPVAVGAETAAELRFTGKVRALDPIDQTATIALTATADGHRIFGRATAIVALGHAG
jgi:acyl dehydratase